MKMPLENLQSLVRCMVCNKKHRPRKMLVLEEDDKRTALHLSCDVCGTSSLVFLSQGQLGIVSLGMMTDLEQGEARRMYQGVPVSTDEVLEIHQALKGFKGDIQDLL